MRNSDTRQSTGFANYQDGNQRETETYPPNTSTADSNSSTGILNYIQVNPLGAALNDVANPPITVASEMGAQPHQFIFRNLIYLYIFALFVSMGLMLWAVFAYKIRLYETQARPSETLVFFWLLKVTFRIMLGMWFVRYQALCIPEPRSLIRLKNLYNMASAFWVASSVYFLTLGPKEDLRTTSCKLCHIMLWVTIASYLAPALTLTLVFVFLCFLLFLMTRFRSGATNKVSVPSHILQKMKVLRYDKILEEIRDGIKNSYELEDCPELSDTDDSKDRSGDKVTITVSQGPDHTKSKSKLEDCCDNDVMLSERLCAICMLEMEDADKVYLMPCDIRHTFHKGCLEKWLRRSTTCPVCRSDIVELLESGKPDG